MQLIRTFYTEDRKGLTVRLQQIHHPHMEATHNGKKHSKERLFSVCFVVTRTAEQTGGQRVR